MVLTESNTTALILYKDNKPNIIPIKELYSYLHYELDGILIQVYQLTIEMMTDMLSDEELIRSYIYDIYIVNMVPFESKVDLYLYFPGHTIYEFDYFKVIIDSRLIDLQQIHKDFRFLFKQYMSELKQSITRHQEQ